MAWVLMARSTTKPQRITALNCSAYAPMASIVYFDNVGGNITDAVFSLMNMWGRISVCGQISQYNLIEPEMGPRMMAGFIGKRLQMQGFLVGDFADQHTEGLQQMSAWLKEGRLNYREDIVEGLENAPQAFIGMLRGDNIGKRLVKCDGN